MVNGIVQPSSLVMGYVYRPYTANSFMFGLQISLVMQPDASMSFLRRFQCR